MNIADDPPPHVLVHTLVQNVGHTAHYQISSIFVQLLYRQACSSHCNLDLWIGGRQCYLLLYNKTQNLFEEHIVVAWTALFSLHESLSLFSVWDRFAFVLPLHLIHVLNNSFAKRKMLSGNELSTGHGSGCECVCLGGPPLPTSIFMWFFAIFSFLRICPLLSLFLLSSPKRLTSSELSLHTPALAPLTGPD